MSKCIRFYMTYIGLLENQELKHTSPHQWERQKQPWKMCFFTFEMQMPLQHKVKRKEIEMITIKSNTNVHNSNRA